ncbi:MAG: acyl-homoserine-lactone synthase, partial [Pseudomonadota bacterium]
MLRYVYATDLHKFPKLARTMFEDRADQFKTRLGWDVRVDALGHERDVYDALN